MADLSTTYLGLKLRNPLVVSSSSLTDSLEKIRELQEAGAGAVVLKSLFEEQLLIESDRLDASLAHGDSSPEATRSYFADIDFEVSSKDYLRLLEGAKKAASIPVLASLNCRHPGKWGEYARQIEGAGADALELNVYWIPTDTTRTGAEIERTYLEIFDEVRRAVKLPVAVKLSPFFTSLPRMVADLAAHGANGVVLFNRFYQPDLDLDGLGLSSRLQLSRPDDLLVPLRWIALLHGRVGCELAASGGVHDGAGALKALAAGASVAQVCSTIFKNKAKHLDSMLRQIHAWLDEHEYASVNDVRGILSQKTCPDPEAFERAQYIKLLVGHD